MTTITVPTRTVNGAVLPAAGAGTSTPATPISPSPAATSW